ncbi:MULTISPECIES: hypothetical protein [unclassified Sphingomonas]|uniref:hypothetical protein n=1 Tax=unclassified Sphingomonas TaxID=196159 RepID=UPI000E7166DC|nr:MULTISPECIES: hypothetical protein [unclassified Sphingomonas]RKE45945.1 hypothetical protein C8J39_3086 [Sphingomonas sp. PP-CC-1A-547]TCM06894.1 hypothetical protein C8J41_104319 [Sphingomonas sp. PP-CC-3G-468]
MAEFALRTLQRGSLNRLVPIVGAIAGGVIAAAGVMLSSGDALEALVSDTGIAALIPMAAPPLGATARAILALGAGALIAAILWSSLYLLFGPGGVFAGARPREDGVPVIRRADAHPDAPPRKPMSAADLGTPLMEVGVAGATDGAARDERTIPADLDLPLAAYDPKAMRPVPMEPARPVAPLAQPTMVAPVIEMSPTAEPDTFVTAPVPKPVEPPVVETSQPVEEVSAPTPIARPLRAQAEPTTPPTIETLLQRLEQGALRRGRIGSH